MEAITFWSFVGPGLRLSLEVLGPEYYMQINTLNPELNVFFSREVKGKAGEDMVESFLDGNMPRETWEDGVFVVELVMASYMAAEKGKTLSSPPKGLEEFVPKVARGTWNPRSIEEAPFE